MKLVTLHFALCFAGVASRVPLGTAQVAGPAPLAEATACDLARSIDPRPRRLPALVCEPQVVTDDASVPHPEWFVAYQLLAPDAPEYASVNRGFYAINRITADAWELVLCKRVSSPKIRHVQA